MLNIKILDQYSLEFYKNWWANDDIELAMCLGLHVDNRKIVADIRQINNFSLYSFMKSCAPEFLNAAEFTGLRKTVFAFLKEAYDRVEREFTSSFIPQLELPKPLYKHQTEALTLMAHRKYNLLSFEQGLGKTITSATLSMVLNIPRTIIICPALVKWNWYHDMVDDWGFDPLNWTILDRMKKHSMYAFRERFVVINYEQVSKFMDYLCRDSVGHIVIDECQYIKNVSTKQRYKPIAELVKRNPNARVTLLSGTPISNRVIDLYAYLKLTKHPLGRTKKGFMERYVLTDNSFGHQKIVGAKNIADLRVRISNFMIRRKAEECLDLPEMLINKYYFKFDEFKKEYDECIAEMYEKKKHWNKDKESMKLQRFGMEENLHTLNRLVATSKAKQIKVLIDDLIERGEKVVVFAGYKDALGALEQMYGDACVKIDGSVPSHERHKLIEKFKKNKSCHVFLGNFVAAGVGINLVNSCHVIFMNFPFIPTDLEQPYKRLHRIGQKRKVNVYYTIAEGTIDEDIFSMIMSKSEDINSIIDEGKDGVVHYSKIKNKLFNSLMKGYEKKNNILPTDNLQTL